MKKIIYTLLVATFAVLTGCIEDNRPVELPQTAEVDGSVSLNISMPTPVAKDMGRTRAAIREFNTLENINILIAQGNTIEDNLYIELDESRQIIAPTNLPTGVTYTAQQGNDLNPGIHFSNDWFKESGISPETVQFFLVGNYGEEIDPATVEELRKLKSPEPWTVGYKVLYGESGKDLGNHTHATHPESTTGRTLKVELEHLAAAVTIVINGNGLKGNVEIIPQSIALHNIPTWSYLGKEANAEYDIDDNKWTPNGEAIDVSSLWGSVGKFTGNNSPLGNATSLTVGAHYDNINELGTNDGAIPALFMLENIHGAGFGAIEGVNQITGQGKRPNGVTGSEFDEINEYPETASCSYLEVKARYMEYDSNGNTKQGGEITYRVFLGEDVISNFDVKRNNYYRFTLVLSGTGIGEGEDDIYWRVEETINGTSVLDESDFILNGAGEMIVIDELIAKDNGSDWDIDYLGDYDHGDVNNDNAWLWMVNSQNKNQILWKPLPLTDAGLDPGKLYTVVDGNSGNMQFRLFVDPMKETDGVSPNIGYSRQVTFTLSGGGDYTSDEITITQYAPTVTRLTEENTPEEIKTYIEEVLGRSLPMNIYFDRVDRTADQWGFETETITANSNSGYTNGLYWLNTGEVADYNDYLPFGDGSAMMHAAFLNYYQLSPREESFTGEQLGTPVTIGQIREAAGDDDNPTVPNPIVPNSIPSRAEWKLLEMLDEAGLGVFDSRHDIVPWQPYWTSDAVEGGGAQSYAYSRYASDSFVPTPRTTSLPYRMIYIEQ
jgi:hypothetical protein